MYETLKYYDMEDFCEFINEEEVNSGGKFEYFGIVAKYEQARDVIAELVFLGYKLGSIDLNFEYFDEYEITVLEDSIMCEPMKRKGEYILSGATTVYAMENVNSKCIKESYPDADKVFIVEFENYGDADECEDESEDISVDTIKDDDGCVHGFTLSSSDGDRYVTHSFYSTDVLDTMKMMDMLSDVWIL